MEPIKLSLANAVELAEAAVAKRGPDHIHEGPCVYAHEDGSPSCLVGEILYLKGRLQDAVIDNYDGVSTLISDHILVCDTVTEEFLSVLQYSQDHGTTWGLALQRAKSRYAAQFLEDLEDLPADQLEETVKEGVQQ